VGPLCGREYIPGREIVLCTAHALHKERGGAMPEENAFKFILLAGDIEVNLGMPVKIAHLNARSLQNRVHYILTKVLVAENDFDIFTVSETWLNNSVTD